jgi:hypothetical protein
MSLLFWYYVVELQGRFVTICTDVIIEKGPMSAIRSFAQVQVAAAASKSAQRSIPQGIIHIGPNTPTVNRYG